MTTTAFWPLMALALLLAFGSAEQLHAQSVVGTSEPGNPRIFPLRHDQTPDQIVEKYLLNAKTGAPVLGSALFVVPDLKTDFPAPKVVMKKGWVIGEGVIGSMNGVFG